MELIIFAIIISIIIIGISCSSQEEINAKTERETEDIYKKILKQSFEDVRLGNKVCWTEVVLDGPYACSLIINQLAFRDIDDSRYLVIAQDLDEYGNISEQTIIKYFKGIKSRLIWVKELDILQYEILKETNRKTFKAEFDSDRLVVFRIGDNKLSYFLDFGGRYFVVEEESLIENEN